MNPKKDEDTTDWYDKNKFNKILTAIDSNGFNHKNKIGNLKFHDISNLVNDIKNNTISDALAKQKLNVLNQIKKGRNKNKRVINGQKILLKLFDDLVETIYLVKKENNSNNVSVTENENVNNIDDNVDNYFNIIDKTQSFEDQMIKLKKIDDLNQCLDVSYCDDNKKLNFKIFKIKLAHISNDVDEQLFEKIVGHKYVALADKLLNTTSKEENQIFINNIKKK